MNWCLRATEGYLVFFLPAVECCLALFCYPRNPYNRLIRPVAIYWGGILSPATTQMMHKRIDKCVGDYDVQRRVSMGDAVFQCKACRWLRWFCSYAFSRRASIFKRISAIHPKSRRSRQTCWISIATGSQINETSCVVRRQQCMVICRWTDPRNLEVNSYCN